MQCISQQEISMHYPTASIKPQMQGGDYEDAKERRLLAQIADSQDMQALERLYAIYVPRISQFLHRLTTDAQHIEEVSNDVMMVVWKKAKQFDGRSKVSTWIFSISYRICIKVLRKSSWRPEINGDEYEKLSSTWVDETVNRDENKDLISLAVQKLSPKHRMVVELSYFLDRTYEEISEITDCPVNTVKTRMFHARKQLREIVNSLS